MTAQTSPETFGTLPTVGEDALAQYGSQQYGSQQYGSQQYGFAAAVLFPKADSLRAGDVIASVGEIVFDEPVEVIDVTVRRAFEGDGSQVVLLLAGTRVLVADGDALVDLLPPF